MKTTVKTYRRWETETFIFKKLDFVDIVWYWRNEQEHQ